MFNITELQHKVMTGGIAVDESLQNRIMNNQLTEDDYKFLDRSMNIKREAQAQIRALHIAGTEDSEIFDKLIESMRERGREALKD